MTTEIQGIGLLYAAFAKAQGEFTAIARTSSGLITPKKGAPYPFKYADLAELIAATRPALAANGLSVMQKPTFADRGYVIETVLMHESGHAITAEMPIPPFSGDLKAYGASLTLLRRYAYAAILNLAAEDDADKHPEDWAPDTLPPESDEPPFEGRADQDELPMFSPAAFETELPGWVKGVLAGRVTPEAIVAMIESKYRLTEVQRHTILDIQIPSV